MSGSIRLRGGRGLGDSIYLRPIAERLVAQGKRITAMSDYPDVFIGSGADVSPFRRNDVDIVAHYVLGKSNPETTQWADMCASAGIAPALPLRFDWTMRNPALIERLRTAAAGRPLVVVHGGRAPYGRTDGFGSELIPGREAFAEVLAALADCFLVQIGKAPQLYPLAADLNLNGSTSVSDLLDIGRECDAIVAQCSFAVPLAEVFDKPFLGVWAQVGLESVEPYVKATTPKKILSKPSSRHVIDGWGAVKLKEDAHAFRRLF